MDIKQRIDGLSEEEVKAALKNIVMVDAQVKKELDEFMIGFSADGRRPLEFYANKILDVALKEAQYGHKNED